MEDRARSDRARGDRARTDRGEDGLIGGSDGVSRRELLKRAAAVGAAAWTAPIVSTFNAPAFAGGDVSPLCPPWECDDPIIECGEGANGMICVCDVDVEGNSFCWNDMFCVDTVPCTNSGECPPGWRCVTNCCEGTRCFPPCGTPVEDRPFDAAGSQATGSGRRR